MNTLVRAGAIDSMRGDRAIYRSLAIEGDRIRAVSTESHGLDHLAGPGTRIIDHVVRRTEELRNG